MAEPAQTTGLTFAWVSCGPSIIGFRRGSCIPGSTLDVAYLAPSNRHSRPTTFWRVTVPNNYPATLVLLLLLTYMWAKTFLQGVQEQPAPFTTGRGVTVESREVLDLDLQTVG